MSMSENTTLIIYGCGGHARSVADVALSNNEKNIIFIDNNAKPGEKIFGYNITPYDIDLADNHRRIIAVGDNQSRASLYENLIIKYPICNVAASTAYISAMSNFESGVFIGHAAHIGPNVKIGAATIINTRSVIEHDCFIGKYCHISVNATVAGKCKIEDFVMIGAGATVIDGITICSNVTIGAGAIVVKSISEPGTYVGVPAKKIKDVP